METKSLFCQVVFMRAKFELAAVRLDHSPWLLSEYFSNRQNVILTGVRENLIFLLANCKLIW